MQLDLNQLCELLVALDQTDISELTLKSGDFELTLRKSTPVVDVVPASGVMPPVGIPAWGAAAYPPPPTVPAPVVAEIPAPAVVPADAAPPPPPPSGPPASDKKLVDIISPMVGTFYSAPGPDEAPYVEVGDRITVGQTVCIIEAMKLMNEIEAEVSGLVVEVLGKNAEPVEYGQVLMRIKVD